MTFCVIARDPQADLLGIALATSPIAVGARCPFIRAGVGAVSTQAYTDPRLGPLALDLLARGHLPAQVLHELSRQDPHFEWRQVGIVDRLGRSAVHTGSQCGPGESGQVTGDNYLVMANYMLNKEVVPAMDAAWHASAGRLFEERLMATAIAARDAGGDMAGHRSACIVVHDADSHSRTDLRVDFAPKRPGEPDAIDQLADMLERWKELIPYYKMRPANPTIISWKAWLDAKGKPFHD